MSKSFDHRCYWLDEEHTQFLYWIHHVNGEWEPVVLTLDKDAPWEVLDTIAQSYHDESLNDRYQEGLLDYDFILKRIRYEKNIGNYAGGRGIGHSDPFEELPGSILSIFDELFPDSVDKKEYLKEKFSNALEQLEPQQIDLLWKHYIDHKTIQAICDEENQRNGTSISHQAISNRLDKIFRRIAKLMPELGEPAPRRRKKNGK